MIRYTQTTNLVSLFIGTNHFVVNKEDGRFNAVIKALKNQEWELVKRYVDPTVALNLPHLKIVNYVFYWKDHPLPENFYKIFLELVSSNRSLIPYIYCIIDNQDNPEIKRIIETFCNYRNYIMPLNSSGKRFIYSRDTVRYFDYHSQSLSSKVFLDIFKGEYQQLTHIKEDTYEQFLNKKYGTGILSGIFKNIDVTLNLAVLEKMYECVSHFEYTKENIEFLYKRFGSLRTRSGICENRFFNSHRLPTMKKLFKMFSSIEKLNNWITKTNNTELEEVLDNMRRINDNGADEILKGFVSRSNGFDQLLEHLLNLVASSAFSGEEHKYLPPQGLKKYIYRVDDQISIRFPFSNKDLYAYGVIYKNCAFTYHQQILDGKSIVFSVVVDNKNKFLVEISKAEGKKSHFCSQWFLRQFKAYANANCHSTEELEIQRRVMKKISEIGFLIKK